MIATIESFELLPEGQGCIVVERIQHGCQSVPQLKKQKTYKVIDGHFVVVAERYGEVVPAKWVPESVKWESV